MGWNTKPNLVSMPLTSFSCLSISSSKSKRLEVAISLLAKSSSYNPISMRMSWVGSCLGPPHCIEIGRLIGSLALTPVRDYRPLISLALSTKVLSHRSTCRLMVVCHQYITNSLKLYFEHLLAVGNRLTTLQIIIYPVGITGPFFLNSNYSVC